MHDSEKADHIEKKKKTHVHAAAPPYTVSRWNMNSDIELIKFHTIAHIT